MSISLGSCIQEPYQTSCLGSYLRIIYDASQVGVAKQTEADRGASRTLPLANNANARLALLPRSEISWLLGIISNREAVFFLCLATRDTKLPCV